MLANLISVKAFGELEFWFSIIKSSNDHLDDHRRSGSHSIWIWKPWVWL